MDNTATAAQGGGWTSWLILIVMFAALYFLMIRPQNKKEKEARKMRNDLKPGDKIITIGGFCGTVARVKEDSDRVVIMVGSERTKLEILRSAIAQIDNSEEASGTKAVKSAEDIRAEEAVNKPNKKNIKKLGAREAEEKAETSEAPAEKAE